MRIIFRHTNLSKISINFTIIRLSFYILIIVDWFDIKFFLSFVADFILDLFRFFCNLSSLIDEEM